MRASRHSEGSGRWATRGGIVGVGMAYMADFACVASQVVAPPPRRGRGQQSWKGILAGRSGPRATLAPGRAARLDVEFLAATRAGGPRPRSPGYARSDSSARRQAPASRGDGDRIDIKGNRLRIGGLKTRRVLRLWSAASGPRERTRRAAPRTSARGSSTRMAQCDCIVAAIMDRP